MMLQLTECSRPETRELEQSEASVKSRHIVTNQYLRKSARLSTGESIIYNVKLGRPVWSCLPSEEPAPRRSRLKALLSMAF